MNLQELQHERERIIRHEYDRVNAAQSYAQRLAEVEAAIADELTKQYTAQYEQNRANAPKIIAAMGDGFAALKAALLAYDTDQARLLYENLSKQHDQLLRANEPALHAASELANVQAKQFVASYNPVDTRPIWDTAERRMQDKYVEVFRQYLTPLEWGCSPAYFVQKVISEQPRSARLDGVIMGVIGHAVQRMHADFNPVQKTRDVCYNRYYPTRL